MIINHNLSAIGAHRLLGINEGKMKESISKLSSGLRINKAADDAAGLAVSEKMRAQIRGLSQAHRNTMDGISLVQTTEGWLQETEDIVHRIRELAIQSANGIYTDEDRSYIQKEIFQLKEEINRISKQAEFNGIKLLTGRWAEVEKTVKDPKGLVSGGIPKNGIVIHVGANVDQNVEVFIEKMDTESLGLTKEYSDVTKRVSAEKTIMGADKALRKINEQRANLGAFQNRLEHTLNGVALAVENLQAAESRIRDADMAGEMVKFVTRQILTQSNTTMLAQANVLPQMILKVLG